MSCHEYLYLQRLSDNSISGYNMRCFFNSYYYIINKNYILPGVEKEN